MTSGKEAALRAVGAAMIGLCAYAIYAAYTSHQAPTVARAKHVTPKSKEQYESVDIQMESMAEKAADTTEKVLRDVKKGVANTINNASVALRAEPANRDTPEEARPFADAAGSPGQSAARQSVSPAPAEVNVPELEMSFAEVVRGEADDAHLVSEERGSFAQVLKETSVDTKEGYVKKPQLCHVRFEVVCDASPHEHVAVVGASEELGEWDAARALHLATNEAIFPKFVGTATLPQTTKLEYKFLVMENKTNQLIRWEGIHGNRTLDNNHKPEATITGIVDVLHDHPTTEVAVSDE